MQNAHVMQKQSEVSFEDSDGWSLTTVRCFAPAEVKASNPFRGSSGEGGAWEQLQQNTERHHKQNKNTV